MKFTLRTIFLLLWIVLLLPGAITAQQPLWEFTSVPPQNEEQYEAFILPPTHTFQVIARGGDPFTTGGNLPGTFDFTGYVGWEGSSTRGVVSLNHEQTPGAVTLHGVHFDFSTFNWVVDYRTAVNFTPVVTITRNCSGAVTPWRTIITCEETANNGDANGDGYHDVGWCTEFDPFTGFIKDHDGDGQPDKIWKAGRCYHENAAVDSTGSILYTGSDHPTLGYFYKFVPDSAGNFGSGNLYSLKLTENGRGDWIQIPNATPEECNLSMLYAGRNGCNNFNGIEDVEFGPDGKIYFASKGHGRVYRFDEKGSHVENFETYVGGRDYEIDYGDGVQTISWGWGNDNLAFDGAGNLWVLQDGSHNHIWVVRRGHTQENPRVELFGRTPNGAEPTGITFSPDYKFLFMSFQHPSGLNNSEQPDCNGNPVVFNRDIALVISRDENLGIPAGMTIFSGFDAQISAPTDVLLTWNLQSQPGEETLIVERASNGTIFEEIGQVSVNKTTTAYSFTDLNPGYGTWYYRIKRQLPLGVQQFSEIQSVTVPFEGGIEIETFPVPTQDLIFIHIFSGISGTGAISLRDLNGNLVENQEVEIEGKRRTTFSFDMRNHPSGIYLLQVETSQGFVRTRRIAKISSGN